MYTHIIISLHYLFTYYVGPLLIIFSFCDVKAKSTNKPLIKTDVTCSGDLGGIFLSVTAWSTAPTECFR